LPTIAIESIHRSGKREKQIAYKYTAQPLHKGNSSVYDWQWDKRETSRAKRIYDNRHQ